MRFFLSRIYLVLISIFKDEILIYQTLLMVVNSFNADYLQLGLSPIKVTGLEKS
jgi:hypothetical protein